MKKFSLKLPTLCLAIFGTWFLGTQLAHAEIVTSLLGFEGLSVIIAQVLANVLNTFQMIAAWILAMAGFLLNYSINLTLQMKTFLEQTPAIYTTWKALRDISGLFIIFFLLYAAIKLILSIQDAKFGSLIKNIVVAGVLINFSFFFASLGIDVSNIVSIQLYNAIAPANTLNVGNLSPTGVTERIGDGGLSDVFMKSLKIPALYDTNAKLTPAGQVAAAGGAWTAPIKIILMGSASIIIMLAAALSFAAAAFAFIIRFVVLIFLLAFSPIWFASHIVPEIGDYAKKWTNAYKGMLIFMPAYLLLMYLALNVLTTSPFLGGTDIANAAASVGTGSTVWYSSILTLSINAVIVMILLNFPLVAAISIGGGTVKFANATVQGASRWVRNNTVGAASTRIIGGAANYIDKKVGGTRIGNTLIARDIRGATTGALAKNKFGTGRSYEDLNKINKDIKTKDKEIGRIALVNTLIKKNAPLKEVAAAVKDMGDKEKLALGAETLADPRVAAQLKGSDFEAIKKSDDFSDEEKKAVSDARTRALEDAVKASEAGDATTLNHMIGNMDGKDLLKFAEKKADILTNANFVLHLKQSQLKTMDDEGLDMDTKKKIAETILKTSPPHKSVGFIKKNKASWGVEEEAKKDEKKQPQVIAAVGGTSKPEPEAIFIPQLKKTESSPIFIPPSSPNPPKFSKTYAAESNLGIGKKPPIIIPPQNPPKFGNN